MSEIKRTLREQRFIDTYIESDGNATQAWMILYPKTKRSNARAYGSRMLQKVAISAKELFSNMGLTRVKIHQKLIDGFNAKKVISVIPIKPKKNQENSPDLPDANSKSIEFIEVDDWNIQHKFVETILKLNNEYPAEKIEHSGKLEPLTVIIRKRDK